MLLGGIIVLLALLAFGASFLALSATGHVLNRQALLTEQLAECTNEVRFQARVTRKALVSELQKVEGYRQPEPTELERAWSDLQQGREPVLDFGPRRP